MSDRQPCKNDLSDERWALIETVIASWKAQYASVSGHQGAYEMRGRSSTPCSASPVPAASGTTSPTIYPRSER
ncbi:hypothetical protein ACFXOM_23190 [Streptomyces sp. NPDC059169]|uniref:hypothetical protein n=1 Tax=Streptomyces sp. NPDC059169 TaxID=3346754 RepID=UPI0036C11175